MPQTDHQIPLDEAIAMVTRFRQELPKMLQSGYEAALPFAETFDKSVFEKLAGAAGSVSIRAYLGLDDKKQVRLIFVGVDEKNNDILPDQGGELFEYGTRCPPICTVGPLNPQTS